MNSHMAVVLSFLLAAVAGAEEPAGQSQPAFEFGEEAQTGLRVRHGLAGDARLHVAETEVGLPDGSRAPGRMVTTLGPDGKPMVVGLYMLREGQWRYHPNQPQVNPPPEEDAPGYQILHRVLRPGESLPGWRTLHRVRPAGDAAESAGRAMRLSPNAQRILSATVSSMADPLWAPTLTGGQVKGGGLVVPAPAR